jgi:hypothetical protein
MSGSWNSHDQLKARMAACKGDYSPYRYKVRVDDEHDRWKYRLASTALWGQSVDVPSFFILCAEYVIQHHRGLKSVRQAIRQAERQIEKDKKAREREDEAWRRELAKRAAEREREVAEELAREEGSHER